MDFAKDRIINIRVDEETQQAIKEAAEARGQSITTFVLDVAKREAREDESDRAAANVLPSMYCRSAAGRHRGLRRSRIPSCDQRPPVPERRVRRRPARGGPRTAGLSVVGRRR